MKEHLHLLKGYSSGELTTVHKNGIVNTCKRLVDNKHKQLIWNGRLRYVYHTRLWCCRDGSSLDLHEDTDIKIFNAVYFNGIQIVRKGKVHY